LAKVFVRCAVLLHEKKIKAVADPVCVGSAVNKGV